jgi:hypothetical protein
MPYAINTPALLELQVVGLLHAQTTRNVFHYAKADTTTIADGAAHLQAFSLAFTANLTAAMRGCASNEWSVQRVTYQWIKPTRYRQFEVQIFPNAGTVVQNSLPSGASICLSKTTRRSGVKWRGRTYLAGIPATFEDDSKVAAAAAAPLATLMTLLSGVQTINGVPMYPWVNKDAPTGQTTDTEDHTIDSVIYRPPLRYQRRREVGVGE